MLSRESVVFVVAGREHKGKGGEKTPTFIKPPPPRVFSPKHQEREAENNPNKALGGEEGGKTTLPSSSWLM